MTTSSAEGPLDVKEASTKAIESKNRRQSLKSAGAVAVLGVGMQLPSKWVSPLVDAVILPSHAQATGGAGGAGGVGGKNPVGCGRAANSNPSLCCDNMDPTTEQYAQECCNQAARDANGAYLRDKSGRILCCEQINPADAIYSEYCCKKRVKTNAGAAICCDDLSVDHADYKKYCCENKAKDAAGQEAKDSQGNPVCCEGSKKDPDFCCIKSNLIHQQTIPRRRTTWKSGVSGVPVLEIPQWNPADGPLSKVSIHLSSTMAFDISVENIDASPTGIDVTIAAEAKVKISGPNGMEIKVRSPDLSRFEHMDHGDEDALNPKPVPFNPGGGSSVLVLKGLGGKVSDELVISSAADLGAFIGSGKVQFAGDSWADNSITADNGAGSGNVFSLIETFSDLQIRVTYDCETSKV